MDEIELSACIDWVALGYEIVQSMYPGWQFAAADTIAAGGSSAYRPKATVRAACRGISGANWRISKST